MRTVVLWPALWSALFARERGAHAPAQVATLIVLAAATGIAAARAGGAAVVDNGAPLALLNWLVHFDVHAALVLGLAGVFRLLARPAEDRASGWLIGYIASGGTRQGYLLALCGAVVAAMTAALVTVAPVFGVAHALAGGGVEPLQRLPRVIFLAPLVIASMCVAATLVGAIARDTGAAITIAFLLTALPLAVAAPYALRGELPGWAGTLLFLHLPPRPPAAGAGFVLQHAAYILIVGGVLLGLADRLVARRA